MHEILSLLPAFSYSLGLTLLLEFGVALVFRMRGRDWILFLLVNLLTNPATVYLNLLFSTLLPDVSVFAWQMPLEISVVAAEGALYAKFAHTLRTPWIYACVANMFSYGTGLLLGFLIS